MLLERGPNLAPKQTRAWTFWTDMWPGLAHSSMISLENMQISRHALGIAFICHVLSLVILNRARAYSMIVSCSEFTHSMAVLCSEFATPN